MMENKESASRLAGPSRGKAAKFRCRGGKSADILSSGFLHVGSVFPALASLSGDGRAS